LPRKRGLLSVRVGGRFLIICFKFFLAVGTHSMLGVGQYRVQIWAGGKNFSSFSKMTDKSKILFQTINSRLICNRKNNFANFMETENRLSYLQKLQTYPVLSHINPAQTQKHFFKFMPLFTSVVLEIFLFISGFNIKFFYTFLICHTCAVSLIAFAPPPP
jgi:hypothetical protein